MEPTDQELIRAIQAGRAEAFDALYHRYRDWVAALAYRFTGLPEGSVGMARGIRSGRRAGGPAARRRRWMAPPAAALRFGRTVDAAPPGVGSIRAG